MEKDRRMLVIFITLLCMTWPVNTETENDLSSTTATTIVKENGIAEALNEFGYKLLTTLMDMKENENTVISPTGIAGLLAMTLLGSAGNTYDELAYTLGFSQDILTNRKNHEEFGDLLQYLNTNDTSSRTVYADAIFVDTHTQLREAYRMYLKRVYNGDALGTDFHDKEKAMEMINEWVIDKTNGKITDFLEKPLPDNTKLLLLSALYFSGQWEQPFVPEYTKRMDFKAPSGNIVADLMLNMGRFNYYLSREDDMHMLALPYNDSTTVLYVLKPILSRRLSLSDLMKRLNYSKVNEYINKLNKQEIVIRFPKLEIKSKVNLEKALKELGLKSIFTPNEANFALMVEANTKLNNTEEELITRINDGRVESLGLKDQVNGLPNPGVYVDSVIHDVKMTINEYGTEAAAASAGILARTAAMFYADSPFYMFIRNEKTKLVTFSAAIFDPTQ